MASSADVPEIYDVWIDGHGYIFAHDTDSPYFSRHPQYGQTPTFIERQNVGNAYGDDQLAFWLTAAQSDWSAGAGRVHFNDADGSRYLVGSDINTTIPGEVTVRSTFDNAQQTHVKCVMRHGSYDQDTLYWANATNVISSAVGGSPSTAFAHGCTTPVAMTCDQHKIYVLDSASKIRAWDGASVTTFAAASAANKDIAYLNNGLYGLSDTALYAYSTGGVESTLYTWKSADGTAFHSGLDDGGCYELHPNGGTLYILFSSEIWKFDGTNTTHVASFDPSFSATGGTMLYGTLYITGVFRDLYGTTTKYYSPALLSFDGTALSVEWRVQGRANSSWVKNNPIAFDSSILFIDFTSSVYTDFSAGTGFVMRFDPASGAVSEMVSLPANGAFPSQVMLTSSRSQFAALHYDASSSTKSGFLYSAAGISASGILYTSAFDMNTSRPKLFRGITVEWEGGGTGASVDIAYLLDKPLYEAPNTLHVSDVVNLQTGAVSGTEYSLSGVTGHRIIVRVTINTNGNLPSPRLTRIFVRAAPILNTYKRRTYVLNLSGNKKAPQPNIITLRNGSPHTKDGDDMRTDLVASITNGSTISITDRFGTFTGIAELDQTIFEEIGCDYGRAEYKVTLVVREV